MPSYVETIERLPAEQRWRQVRQWMDGEPLAFYGELRDSRPILKLPEVTLVARFSDCTSVLRQHDAFTVALYKPKQSDFWMSQDDTPQHWREKSIMRSILDRDRLADIRQYVAAKAASLLQDAGGRIDAVGGLSRAVPIAFVQERFGFDESDPDDIATWSYWNQYDAFHNQGFDAIRVANPEAVIEQRKAANRGLRAYLGKLVERRAKDLQDGKDKTDPVARLLKLHASGALAEAFDPVRIGQNVGGLLIGTIETTSHATINALAWLLAQPEICARATVAATNADPTAFDGYVFEALRFNPPFPYFFRLCEKATPLAVGTDCQETIEPGTTVMPLVHAAMFDPAAFPDPDTFDPTRSQTNTFHFGYGLHECLGIHIGRQTIPEIVRQVLLLPEIKAIGPVDKKGGPFPEAYPLAWCQA